MLSSARRATVVAVPVAVLLALPAAPAFAHAKPAKGCHSHCATHHKPAHHKAAGHKTSNPTIASGPAPAAATTTTLSATLLPAVDPRLVESFAVGPTAVIAGQPASFDATATRDPDGTILAWGWDFADGTGGGGPQINHTFSQAGVYRISLTVVDSADHIQTIAEPVVVAPATP